MDLQAGGDVSAGGAQQYVLQLPKAVAKAAKDALKQAGWLDRARRAGAEPGTDSVVLPINIEALKHLQSGDPALPAAVAAAFTAGAKVCESHAPPNQKFQAAQGPAVLLKQAVSQLLSTQLQLPQPTVQKLCEELPSKWEKLGDLILIPYGCMMDPVWEQCGPELWRVVATALQAKRLARQAPVASTGTRDSRAQLLLGSSSWVSHRESGVTYTLDVTRCMFSSGNVTERSRMGGIRCEGEVVLDLFTGIGYYTLPVLVRGKAAKVFACEWNPHAVEALRRNLEVNGVANRCEVLVGDCREVAPKQQICDRVLLGLLPSSKGGWKTAVNALKDQGGWLHIHENVLDAEETQFCQSTIVELQQIASSLGRSFTFRMHHMERVKWYAPHIRHIVMDVEVRSSDTAKTDHISDPAVAAVEEGADSAQTNFSSEAPRTSILSEPLPTTAAKAERSSGAARTNNVIDAGVRSSETLEKDGNPGPAQKTLSGWSGPKSHAVQLDVDESDGSGPQTGQVSYEDGTEFQQNGNGTQAVHAKKGVEAAPNHADSAAIKCNVVITDSAAIPSSMPRATFHLRFEDLVAELAAKFPVSIEPGCDVPIVDALNLTGEDFHEFMSPLRIPLVLRGMDLGPATGKWDPSYFVNLEGAKDALVSCHVCREPSGCMDFTCKNFTFKTMTLAEMVGRSAGVGRWAEMVPLTEGEGKERYYLRSLGANPRKEPSNIAKAFPALAADLVFPPLVPPGSEFSTVLRISSPGLRLWTHYDVMDNLLLQVTGTKEVLLWHPSDVNNLYVSGSSSPVIHVDNPDLARFPAFQQAKAKKCFLQSGDVLFLPSLWFHNVLSHSFSVSVNVFWRHLPGHFYERKDLYGNKDLVAYNAAEEHVGQIKKMLAQLPDHYLQFYKQRILHEIGTCDSAGTERT